MVMLMPDQIADLVNLTLKKYEKNRWVDLSLDKQHYFSAKLFKKGKVRSASGTQYNFKVQVSNTGTARFTEMFDVDQTAVKDLTADGDIPYSKQTVNFSYDEDEDVFNSSPEEIVDSIAVRRHSAHNDYFELMEEAVWSAPSSSSQSPRRIYGFPFWIQKNATEGFTGGNPSGFTDGAAGINANTYTNWKNYSAPYTNITREDFIKKLKKAHAYCKFVAPHSFNELGAGQDYEFQTTYPVLEALEVIVESRNDNLGTDLATYMGSQVMFRRTPIGWVPYLTENDSSNPFYGINWKTFFLATKKGKQGLQWSKPMPAPNQHTVKTVHGDGWVQIGCNNRRGNFVLYVAS